LAHRHNTDTTTQRHDTLTEDPKLELPLGKTKFINKPKHIHISKYIFTCSKALITDKES
jgi:hypothetical protein